MKNRKRQSRAHAKQLKLPSVSVARKHSPSLEMPGLPLAEVLSFLKETRGAISWTDRDMASSLKITAATAKQVLVILELQGYVKKSADAESSWLTTLNGESLSGSITPRFTSGKVKHALSSLAERIKKLNADPHSRLSVTEAVAFGDFLAGRPRVQAADVGIRLEAHGAAAGLGVPAIDERDFMKELRAGSTMIKLRPYESWMNSRSHRRLL